jgi:hypothetical protein
MVDTAALKVASRSIGKWTGAFAQSAYFARECHERYVALGLEPPVGEWRGVPVGPPTTFHASRAAVLGEVTPELAVAAFPQMAPTVVGQSVTRRRRLCDAATLADARCEGAVASLHRILGAAPNGIESLAVIVRRACEGVAVGGRPFAAGLVAQGWVEDPLADVWHGAEILRELRGDAHNSTWLGRGISPPQIHILTEHWYRLSGCGFRRVWGWTTAELDEADGALVESGLIDESGLTERGVALREEIEDATDTQMVPIIRAIADDLEDLALIGERLSRAVVAGKGSLMVRPSYFTWVAAQPAFQFG